MSYTTTGTGSRWGTGEALNSDTHFVDILTLSLRGRVSTLVTSRGRSLPLSGTTRRRPTRNSLPISSATGALFVDCGLQQHAGGRTASVWARRYGETGTLLHQRHGNECRITRAWAARQSREVKERLGSKRELVLLNPSRATRCHFASRNWFRAIRKGRLQFRDFDSPSVRS